MDAAFSKVLFYLTKIKSAIHLLLCYNLMAQIENRGAAVAFGSWCRSPNPEPNNHWHGPTLYYLNRRMVATFDLCTHCFTTESYKHISLICPRFKANTNSVRHKSVQKHWWINCCPILTKTYYFCSVWRPLPCYDSLNSHL